ncbi:hypothetical protein [Desulfopila aestuarii]|uniref:Carbohydrate-binding family V/XII n=1 Tax=Desulfopila aestuarii DSM 18488 TaxID=1121416 RepID=A0A1M7XVN6_9BACT|nr:hypothetical protein [Desulfopila aestuarii]SHO42671.1 hypothetical protein SAMN02745220_00084 [Desulfopila aestuarii DSM 18488]
MHFRHVCTLFLLLVGLGMGITVRAESSDPESPADLGWPRSAERDDIQVTVYQPQVDSWDEYKVIHFRSAISVTPGPGKEERFGVAEFTADTEVDHDNRTVVTNNHQREIRFPNVSEKEEAELRNAFDQILPPRESITVSLDRVLPYLDEDNQSIQPAVDVNLEPPKIFYSKQPAILVMFMGTPQLKPVNGSDPSFLFAANTNWDVFFDTANSRYYLLDEESWLTSDDPIKGSWTPAGELPPQLLQLPDDENWADVRKNIPGKPVEQAPVVFVTTEPSEMIITEGEPAFLPIKDTKLLQVSNTDATLFLHSGDGQFYYLVAGRWFRTKTLDGPWSEASNDLPDDFRNIPDDSPAAFVKAAVPGTRDAEDAVLLASIPQTTSVDLSNPPKMDVVYQGEPQFTAIPGTTVKYGVNTPNQVFMVNGQYYCCSEGMWFTSDLPTGPWQLAASVPDAIYSVPPTNPNYNATYVRVQEATPTTVVYSQTSGYSGEYVAAKGVLMFGMGMLLGAAIADNHHHDYWYPYPSHYSYGVRATYHPGYGGYYSGARSVYGPYGGAGRVAAYNPSTGTYSRGAYRYGPAGSAGVRQAYNPYTGGYAQGGRVNTAYGSAGRFYAERGGKSVSGGYRSGSLGSAGGIRTGQNTGAAAWNTRSGQGAVAKTRSGDVYAGRDGNVYKKDSSGSWQKYENGNWNSLKPQPKSGTQRTATTNQVTSAQRDVARKPASSQTVKRPATSQAKAARPATGQQRPKLNAKNVQQGLQRDAQARSAGERRSSQRQNFQRSGGHQRSRDGGGRRR